MKSVLAIVPYENLYPPMNGGMQRCFHIIHQLAKYFELTIIINQNKEDFLKATTEYPAIACITIYSTKDELPIKDILSVFPKKLQNAFRYRWYKKQFSGPADGSFLQYYPLLKKLLKGHKYDTVILENLASLNAVSIIRKYDRTVNILYDAHNVDSNLASIAIEKGAMKLENQFLINKTESSLYKLADAIFACSQNDLNDLKKMNYGKIKGIVIPNGVSITNKLFDAGVQQNFPGCILFCGALWSPPNNEGLFWFYNAVWPVVLKSFPHLKLLVVGIGKLPDSMVELANDPSLQFSGTVGDVKPWYNKASAAIVPLLSGSGTRLKILEAMSLGLPVISTSKGAEGIAFKSGDDIIIADKEIDFAEAVISLLNSEERRLEIQQSALKLVKDKYDWEIIGKLLASYIDSANPNIE